MGDPEFAEVEGFVQDLQRHMPTFLNAAERVGESGWPFPMWMTLGEVAALAEIQSEEAIDAMFVRFFSRDASRFEHLLRNLSGTALPSRYRVLLRQCVGAYSRGEHQVAVPALLVVVEGTMAELAGASDGNAQVVQLAKKRLLAAEDDIDRIVWTSLHAFTKRLFANMPFHGPAPDGLNRHWLLHGRDAAEWTQADALRLFHAIDTLAVVSAST